jgi:hypothetical protein
VQPLRTERWGGAQNRSGMLEVTHKHFGTRANRAGTISRVPRVFARSWLNIAPLVPGKPYQRLRLDPGVSSNVARHYHVGHSTIVRALERASSIA